MSVNFNFYKKGKSEPLEEEFVKKRLAQDFEILSLDTFEKSSKYAGKVRVLQLRSKKDPLERDDKESGLEFVWGENHGLDPQDNYQWYSTGGFHFGRSEDYAKRVHKVLGEVAEKLDLVAYDWQTGLRDISPEVFSSPEKINQAFERKRTLEKTKGEVKKAPARLMELIQNNEQALLNDIVVAIFMALFIISAFIFKLPLFVLILPFLIGYVLYLDRRTTLTLLGYLLVASYYVYIFTHSLTSKELADYSIFGTFILIVYGIIHFLFYGLRSKKASKLLKYEIDKLDPHFNETDLKVFAPRQYYNYLYTKTFTKLGIINFIILLLLIQVSQYLK